MSLSESNQENTVLPNQSGVGNYSNLKKVAKKAKAEVTQGTKKIISCNLCSTNFATVQFLSKHFLSGVHGIEKCKLCDKPFSSVKTLVQHFVSEDHSAQINANKSANVNNVGKFKFVPSKGFFNKGTPIKRKLENDVNSDGKKIRTDSVLSETSKRSAIPSVPTPEFTPNFLPAVPISFVPPTEFSANLGPIVPISALPVLPTPEFNGAIIPAAPVIPTTVANITPNQELSMDGEENHWIETMITKVENCLENCENLVGKVRDEWIDEISVITTTERLRNVLKFAINNFKMIDKTINDQVKLWSKEAPKPVIPKDNPDAGITCTPDLPEIPCTPSYNDYVDTLFNPNKKPADKSNYEIKKEIIDYNADNSIIEQSTDSNNKQVNLQSNSVELSGVGQMENKDTTVVKKEIVTPEKTDTQPKDSELFHSQSEILNEETIRKQEEILVRMKQVFEAAKGKVPSNDPAVEKGVLKQNEAFSDIPSEKSVDKTVDKSADKTVESISNKDLLLSKAMDEILRSASLEPISKTGDEEVDNNINIKKEVLTPEKKNVSENENENEGNPVVTPNKPNKDNQMVTPNNANTNENKDNQMVTPNKADKTDQLLSNSQLPSKVTSEKDNLSIDSSIDVEKIVGNCHSLQDYLKRILKSLQKLDTNKFFASPVDIDNAPDYNIIIKKPMDFSKMRRKLKHLKYNSIAELEADFCLMIKNCLRYNSKDTIYHKSATELFDKGVTVINFISETMKKSLNAGTIKSTTEDDSSTAGAMRSRHMAGAIKESDDMASKEDSLEMIAKEDSLKLVAEKDSSHKSPLKDLLNPASKNTNKETNKYNTRSRRSLNNSGREEESETEPKVANKEKIETVPEKKVLPKLRIRESKNLIVHEEVAKEKNQEKENLTIDDSSTKENNSKDDILTKKIKKKSSKSEEDSHLTQKEQNKKINKKYKVDNDSPVKYSENESSPENLSKKEHKKKIIKKYKVDNESPVKYSENESSPEKLPKKEHKKKIIKKYKSGNISPVKYSGNESSPEKDSQKEHKKKLNSKYKRDNISPKKYSENESSPSESSPEVSPIKKSKKVFKSIIKKKVDTKATKKVNKKIKRKKSKEVKDSDVEEKAVSTLKNALSNTIEEKAMEMLKNMLMKFTENGENETNTVKRSAKKTKLSKSKNTQENFMNNLIKNLKPKQ